MVKEFSGNTLSVPVRPKRWVVTNLRAAFSAAAIGIVVSLSPPCFAGNVAQTGGMGSDAGQTRSTPKIAAIPQRVKITDSTGTTDLAWNTGNGSMGYVFVTANRGAPALVATGSEGGRVISWIRTGSYVFELYGDSERRTLLAAVTVSGVAEAGALKRAALWHDQIRWLLVAALVAVLYVGIYFSSTGPVRTKFPVEPTTSPHPLHVGRNLLLGLAAFICVDGAVFHTRAYTSILAPESYAGRMAAITRAEKNRLSSGLKEVLVLGDSRMAEGFSAAVADKLGSAAGFKFVNFTEPASSVNIWAYMLREVDPTKRRYWAIVVPYGIGYEPTSADRLRISMAAPLLRYGDCFNFASAFQRWSGRFRAFTACILRGAAYQSDFVDFLAHPIARIRSIQREARLQWRETYKGRDYDIVGTSYDPKTGQMSFPARLTEAQREAIRDSLAKPSESETQDFLRMQRDGIQRILNRYSASPTEIVLTPVPRGPFARLPGVSMTFHAAFPTVATQKAVFSLPEQTFDFLETPEYYFDGYHLNAKGRQRFTETLVTELVGRLRSADMDERLGADSEIVADPFPFGTNGSDIRSARTHGPVTVR